MWLSAAATRAQTGNARGKSRGYMAGGRVILERTERTKAKWRRPTSWRQSRGPSDEMARNNKTRVWYETKQSHMKEEEAVVYLRPASTAEVQIEHDWLCGGAIIDERYILTSAACIEDAKHFYVISGTHRWTSPKMNDDECVKNGQKKAIWKCVPKAYVFDGGDFDNIRWMINDIAVVKTEDEFNFKRRIKGCDFIPKPILYNNVSADYEKPGTLGSIAGWGSTQAFSDVITWEEKQAERSVQAQNNPELQDTEVLVLHKKNCKRRWHERYHWIIDDYMICGKDGFTDMSTACDQEVNCKEIHYSEENDEEDFDVRRVRRTMMVPDPADTDPLRGGVYRRNKPIFGGFCENDHGGPFVVGHGNAAMVIGVISASQVKRSNNHCYGPFLYTSVWNNRHLISCAIEKEMGATCRRYLRASRTQITETTFNWRSHPAGPAKGEEDEMETTKKFEVKGTEPPKAAPTENVLTTTAKKH
ncbi:trypsin domain-containing protein [Phthorimaea operculella]|nr:trypsin domain-containing protein [Phthorimaea operculella]